MNAAFEFQYPWVLALLALLPIYAWLRGRTGWSSALRFPSADLARAAGAKVRSAAGRFLVFLRVLVLACGVVALAGPRFAHDRTETEVKGIDIMLAVDLSWSMMALDMSKPGERLTRFDITRAVIQDFIRRRPDDRIGLMAFSAVPYLASPLTMNHEWLQRNFERMHIGMVRELGTAIGDATVAAVKRLKPAADGRSRIVILLTDGDNNAGEMPPIPAAEIAAAMRVKLYTIGVGKEEACQLPKFDAATGKFLLNPDGSISPMTILQPANYEILDRMSRLTRGRSFRAASGAALAGIYAEIDRLEKSELKIRTHTTYRPLFQWPLLAMLGLWLLELVFSTTRYRRAP